MGGWGRCAAELSQKHGGAPAPQLAKAVLKKILIFITSAGAALYYQRFAPTAAPAVSMGHMCPTTFSFVPTPTQTRKITNFTQLYWKSRYFI